jgi:hypothetical protein
MNHTLNQAPNPNIVDNKIDILKLIQSQNSMCDGMKSASVYNIAN